MLGLLGLLLLCLLLIGVLSLLPPQALPNGSLHPQYATIQSSGSSVADSSPHYLIATTFGLAILGIFGTTLYIGGYKENTELRKRIFRAFFIGMLAYVGVFICLLISYSSYHSTGSSPFFGGFPAPSAWMLYGIWFVPLLISFIYIFKFKEWVLTPEELKEFERIVERRGK